MKITCSPQSISELITKLMNAIDLDNKYKTLGLNTVIDNFHSQISQFTINS